MSAAIPPFELVRREILDKVRSGELLPGDRLPAIRAAASERRLAAGTVAKAYKLLEEAGVILTRRGSGTTIAPEAVAAAEEQNAVIARESGGGADEDAIALLAAPIAEALERGHEPATILASVREALAAAQMDQKARPRR
ncbi:GntR family transcriptional regulator [Brachybacterium sp. DNPG3]